jgi:hypothetical protein
VRQGVWCKGHSNEGDLRAYQLNNGQVKSIGIAWAEIVGVGDRRHRDKMRNLNFSEVGCGLR